MPYHKGCWKIFQNVKLRIALKLYGVDFQKISSYIQTRTIAQCRRRYKNFQRQELQSKEGRHARALLSQPINKLKRAVTRLLSLIYPQNIIARAEFEQEYLADVFRSRRSSFRHQPPRFSYKRYIRMAYRDPSKVQRVKKIHKNYPLMRRKMSVKYPNICVLREYEV